MLAQATTSQSQQYGYGFAIQGTGALKNFGHSGGAPGMSGDLRVFSELGYVVIALSNFDPPAANRMIDFFVSRMPIGTPKSVSLWLLPYVGFGSVWRN